MRDLVYFGHLIGGIALVVISILILYYLKDNKSSYTKPLAIAGAVVSWLLLLPSASLYIDFYPATKTLIKAGAWPWVHSILMETKEHWGILLPFIATVAAILLLTGKASESKKWWVLVLVLSILLAVMGRLIKMGALM
jgi:hypothetical protein